MDKLITILPKNWGATWKENQWECPFLDFCQGGDHGKISCERMFFEETMPIYALAKLWQRKKWFQKTEKVQLLTTF